MSQHLHATASSAAADGPAPRPSLRECLQLLDLRLHAPERFPLAAGDASAGSENELQVAVAGRAGDVDLSLIHI